MKDLELSRFIPGPPSEVFDVWFDPACAGGPWHGAKKVLMNVAVDGVFYFGLDRAKATRRPFWSRSSRAMAGRHFEKMR